MRIYYIANARIPTEKAHGIQIMKMCEAFSLLVPRGEGKKIELELILPNRINPGAKDSFEYYGIKTRFKLTKLPCIDTAPYWGIFGYTLQAMSFLFFVRLYLKAGKDEVVYTREQLTGVFYKGHVLEIHSLPRKISFFHNYLWRRAGKLVVLTSFIKNSLVEAGVSEDKIFVSPDGADPGLFDLSLTKEQARSNIGLPSGKKIALYAGSLSAYSWKGVDIFIQAGSMFDGSTIGVIVGGSAGEIEKLKQRFPEAKLLFFPRVSHGTIPVFLSAADVLVLPNKKGDPMSEYQTSPLKLFEYMASGRPIVASDLPSIREILSEETAYFFKPNDPKSLSSAISEALKNIERSDKIAQRARQEFMGYTWEKRARNIIDFICR